MRMFIRILLLLFIADTFNAEPSRVAPHSCVQGPTILKEVNFGWPLVINCGKIEEFRSETLAIEQGFYEDEDSVNSECSIYDASAGTRLMKKTYSSDELLYGELTARYTNPMFSEGNSTNYIMMLERSEAEELPCFWSQVTVTASSFHQQTCEEFTQNPTHAERVESEAFMQNVITCQGTNTEVLDMQFPVENLSLYPLWYRNCRRHFRPRITLGDDYSLLFDSTWYMDAGSYVCAVEYRGMLKYLMKYDLCVKPQYVPKPAVIDCPQEALYARVGDSLTISFNILVGDGRIDENNFDDVWKQKGSRTRTLVSCGGYGSLRGTYNNIYQKFFTRRYTCQLDLLTTQHCYSTFAKGELRHPSPQRFGTQLHFKKLRKSDFGRYVYKIYSNEVGNMNLERCKFKLLQLDEQHGG